jgi:hypothetical protein
VPRSEGSVWWAAIVAVALLEAIPACAAPPRGGDSDWPCQQRLVPRLAAASYWSGPLDADGDWRADPEVAELVRRLAPRQVTTDKGLTAIADFARTASGDRRHRLDLVFRGLLEETDRERADLISRLQQMGRRQRELADLVARLGDELKSIPSEATDQRLDLQQRHDFTARNFEEIRRTIRYACETPVALDARLGAWARALQQAASGAAG